MRVSQKGMNYLTDLAEEILPQVLQRMVLPTVDQSGLTVKRIVITRFDRPDITANYINGHGRFQQINELNLLLGVELDVTLPMVHINGDFQLELFFTSTKGTIKAVVQNLTIGMKIHIHRDMIINTNNVSVCKM